MQTYATEIRNGNIDYDQLLYRLKRGIEKGGMELHHGIW